MGGGEGRKAPGTRGGRKSSSRRTLGRLGTAGSWDAWGPPSLLHMRCKGTGSLATHVPRDVIVSTRDLWQHCSLLCCVCGRASEWIECSPRWARARAADPDEDLQRRSCAARAQALPHAAIVTAPVPQLKWTVTPSRTAAASESTVPGRRARKPFQLISTTFFQRTSGQDARRHARPQPHTPRRRPGPPAGPGGAGCVCVWGGGLSRPSQTLGSTRPSSRVV